MGFSMDIAAAATQLSASKLAMEYSTSVTKKAMDTQEELATSLIQNMLPSKGQYIDVYA